MTPARCQAPGCCSHSEQGRHGPALMELTLWQGMWGHGQEINGGADKDWGAKGTEIEVWQSWVECSRNPLEEVTLIKDLGRMMVGTYGCWAERELG